MTPYLAADEAAPKKVNFQQEFAVRRAQTHLVAHHEPPKVERPSFVFRQRFLPIEGGRLLLRLNEFPQVEVNPATMECEVQGWGVRVACSKAEELPRLMARRFLELFSKADAQILTEQEQSAWVGILDRVDYRSFCIDRAAPHYVEGKLVRTEPVCRIEWHDGEVTNIDKHVAAPLRVLEPGDHFGAYVKLGHNNEVRAVERVVLLPAA